MFGDDTCGLLHIALDPVLRSQRHSGLDIVGVGLQKIVEVNEELLESGRGNDLQ